MIRVGIVDDQPLFVKGLCRLLEDQQELHIECTANSGLELTTRLDQHHIDILLMDLEMPEEDGFQLIKRLQQDHPGRIPTAAAAVPALDAVVGERAGQSLLRARHA